MSAAETWQQFAGTHLSHLGRAFPMPPYAYKNTKALLISIRTTPDTLRALVPEPLEVNSEHLLQVYIGLFNIVEPLQLRYHEAGILIPTCYEGMAGAYMPVLYLNKTLPITIGREVWGFPKFGAEVTLTEKLGVIQGSVSSLGTPLIKAEIRLTGQEKPPAVEAPTQVFLLKSIPSVQQNASPDVKQLCTAMVRDQVYTEWHPGVATLIFNSTRDDPLGAIPILETISGFYYTRDFVLDYGKVVYDYLTEPAGANDKGSS